MLSLVRPFIYNESHVWGLQSHKKSFAPSISLFLVAACCFIISARCGLSFHLVKIVSFWLRLYFKLADCMPSHRPQPRYISCWPPPTLSKLLMLSLTGTFIPLSLSLVNSWTSLLWTCFVDLHAFQWLVSLSHLMWWRPVEPVYHHFESIVLCVFFNVLLWDTLFFMLHISNILSCL